MKVLLIGNYPYAYQQSMQRFAALLEQGLQSARIEARVLRPEPLIGRIKPGETGVGKWLGYADRFLLFRLKLQRMLDWADLVHICDHANAVYVPWLRGKPHVVTCHDMLAIRSALGTLPEHRTRWSGRVQQRWILQGLCKAQRIVCVSNQTARELLAVADFPKERVAVVPNALNYPYRPMEKTEAAARLARLGVDANRPFFLHVGGNQWYKNRPGVLRIFRHLLKIPGFGDHRLVMAGKTFTEEMTCFIDKAGFADRVYQLASLPNEDLRALYSMAKALIFPSLYEGFGWPIIEAQACGCPVVTSARPPMSEVAGAGVIYIDPVDEKRAAQVMAEGLFARESLRTKGFANVRRFEDSTMIQSYLLVYQEAVREKNILTAAPAGRCS